MRLFIAIEIPDDIKKAFGTLQTGIPGARWVKADQIHLTMAFLGEVEEAGVEQLIGELFRIHTPSFELCFAGTGCFPDRRRPQVLWIGLEPEPHLQTLVVMLRTAVLACGIPQEERSFSPHITLARLKLPPSREVDTFLNQQQKQKLPPFSVREITLFQSLLTPQGAVHIPIRNFHLASSGFND